MSLQDWAAFAKSAIFVAVMGLAILYFLEMGPPLRPSFASIQRAHRKIWKKPRRWQLIVVSALWGLIIAGTMLLVWVHRAR
jgi:hypothetical protein